MTFHSKFEEYDYDFRLIKKVTDKLKDKSVEDLKRKPDTLSIKEDLERRIPAFEKLEKDLLVDSLKPFKDACTLADVNLQEEKDKIGFPSTETIEKEGEIIREVYCRLKAATVLNSSETATSPSLSPL